jgi:hypothetical protein
MGLIGVAVELRLVRVQRECATHLLVEAPHGVVDVRTDLGASEVGVRDVIVEDLIDAIEVRVVSLVGLLEQLYLVLRLCYRLVLALDLRIQKLAIEEQPVTNVQVKQLEPDQVLEQVAGERYQLYPALGVQVEIEALKLVQRSLVCLQYPRRSSVGHVRLGLAEPETLSSHHAHQQLAVVLDLLLDLCQHRGLARRQVIQSLTHRFLPKFCLRKLQFLSCSSKASQPCTCITLQMQGSDTKCPSPTPHHTTQGAHVSQSKRGRVAARLGGTQSRTLAIAFPFALLSSAPDFSVTGPAALV